MRYKHIDDLKMVVLFGLKRSEMTKACSLERVQEVKEFVFQNQKVVGTL